MSNKTGSISWLSQMRGRPLQNTRNLPLNARLPFLWGKSGHETRARNTSLKFVFNTGSDLNDQKGACALTGSSKLIYYKP